MIKQNKMNLKEIQEFIKAVAKSGATDVKLETKDLKLSIKSQPKGKANLPTETTVVQQIPVPSHFPAVPSIHMTQPGVPIVPPPQAQTDTPNAPEEKKEKSEKKEKTNLFEVKAPMVGTFYSKPAPGKPAYVSVGDEIKKGDTICIIEAMKLFNEIESDVSGKIIKILVDDATPIEYDQTLFLVEAR